MDRNKWLRLVYILTLSIIMGYGCLFSFTYISDLVKFEKTILREYREKELLRISGKLDNEYRAGIDTISQIETFFSLYRENPESLPMGTLQLLMSDAMSVNPNQFNCYFALEPDLSRELTGTDAYIMTVKKPITKLGTTEYGDSINRIVEFWYDPVYQASEDEVWYHIAKKSEGYEVSPVYFDSSYMKVWMFTIGKGIYEGDVFKGMFGLDILADSYFEEVETNNLNNTGGLFVASKVTGRIITTTDKNSSSAPFKISDRNQTDYPTGLDDLMGGSGHEIVFRGDDGDSYVMNALPLKHLPWILVSYQNKQKTYGPIYRKAGIILLFSVLLMVSSVSIITFLMSRMSRMFEELEIARKNAEEHAIELKEAQEKLIAAERLAVLGEFAGSVAHEIRNPLGVISGTAFYLQRKLKDVDQKSQEKLLTITNQVERAADIIDSILKLTRMGVPSLDENNLVDLLKQGVASSKIPEGVNVKWNTPSEDFRLLADREQILIATKNIVKNAVEAMDGNGTLSFEVTPFETNDGLWIETRISDTGNGIREDELEKVFTPLHTTKTYGIGFGLSIVKMVIEKHGGTILADSQPGAGATFTIKLPGICR